MVNGVIGIADGTVASSATGTLFCNAENFDTSKSLTYTCSNGVFTKTSGGCDSCISGYAYSQGSCSSSIPNTCAGGVESASSTAKIHTFKLDTAANLKFFSCKSNVAVSYLVVGGGGGGGGRHAGGGGAGGYWEGSGTTALSITAGKIYEITVGAGGAGAQCTLNSTSCSAIQGSNGGDSIIKISSATSNLIIAKGGGGGGTNGNAGKAGGSGGGSSNGATAGGTSDPKGPDGVATASNNSFQGNGGGGRSSAGAGGSGGGGAGAPAAASGKSNGSAGGAGKSSSISGVPTDYAGGGGGGVNANSYTIFYAGGVGGGGRGGRTISLSNGVIANPCYAGAAHTGGGGGGGGATGTMSESGCAGGSGIVIISY